MTEHTWKIEKNLCRCCHSEGAFTNLAEPCLNLGEEEIFSQMLLESFDVNVAPVTGPLCEVTYTICDGCIQRLRDACYFKRQVVKCEKRFHDLYSKNVIKFDSCYEVKVEAPDSDDEDDMKLEMFEDEDDFAVKSDDDEKKLEVQIEVEELTPKPKRKVAPKRKAKNTKVISKLRKKLEAPGKAKDKTEADADESPEADGAKQRKEKKGNVERNAPYTTVVLQDGQKQWMCDVCNRVYARLDLFTQHYRHVHLKLRPKLRSCYLCEVRVPGHLRTRHMEEAHGIPRPQCNACGKKFAFPFQVMSHQKRYHMGEKLFPCPDCDLTFSVPSKLAQHSLKHTSLRPHKCEFCEKSFKWKKNLTTHIMMHLDDRRHVCNYCNDAFVQQTSLKYHLSKRHPEHV